MKTVLLTGASGFLGSALEMELVSAGYRVVPCARQEGTSATGIAFRPYSLQWSELPGNFLSGVDYIIHAAVSKTGPSSLRFNTNVGATKLLLDEAQRQRIPALFVSSLAAHNRAISSYGRHKEYLQQYSVSRGFSVVRPGLILGKGGLFQQMVTHITRCGVIPLLDQGLQPLQTVHIDDLTLAIRNIVQNGKRGIFTVAERNAVPYRTFFEELCAHLCRRPRFVHVPYRAAAFTLTLAEKLHFRLPVDEDNLLGLARMVHQQTNTIELLAAPPRTYRESLQQLLAAQR